MNRRDTVLALLALGSASLTVVAQQPDKVWRAGFLSVRSRPTAIETDYYSAFPLGMRKLGYVEGTNLTIEWRFADGKFERLPDLAAELVRLKVDVIVTAGTQATSAAQKATTTIPIVMGSVADPVGSGLVKNLTRPGGNTTGLSNISGDLILKQREMLLLIAPKLSRVAVLVNPANPSTLTMLKGLQASVQGTRVRILPVEARTAQEIEAAFLTMSRQTAEALVVALDPFLISQGRQLAELATKYRLPSISANREFAEAGGLVSYGQNLSEQFQRAATYVDKIFKGAKPGDLPVEQSMTLETVVNLKTAKALGVAIPPSVLVRADRVIE